MVQVVVKCRKIYVLSNGSRPLAHEESDGHNVNF